MPLVAFDSNSGMGLLTTIAIVLKSRVTGCVVLSSHWRYPVTACGASDCNLVFYPENYGGPFGALSVLSRGGFNEQRNGDASSFSRQNVVGAAGRLGVHGFDAGLFVNCLLYTSD